MTKETLQQGVSLLARIENLELVRRQLLDLDDSAKSTAVKVRIRGLDIELPKAVFKSEVGKKKSALEAELTTLQEQFDAL